MEKVAEDMQVSFEEKIDEVKQVYEAAINAQGLERETKVKLHEAIQHFQLLRSSAEQRLNSAIEAEKKAWKMFEEARNKEFKSSRETVESLSEFDKCCHFEVWGSDVQR